MADNSDLILDELRQQTELLRTLCEGMAFLHATVRRAEEEVPEQMRRFTMYFHDLIHIRWGYESAGHSPPKHIQEECNRATVRMAQLIEEQNRQGGTFAEVREKMREFEKPLEADPTRRRKRI